MEREHISQFFNALKSRYFACECFSGRLFWTIDKVRDFRKNNSFLCGHHFPSCSVSAEQKLLNHPCSYGLSSPPPPLLEGWGGGLDTSQEVKKQRRGSSADQPAAEQTVLWPLLLWALTPAVVTSAWNWQYQCCYECCRESSGTRMERFFLSWGFCFLWLMKLNLC